MEIETTNTIDNKKTKMIQVASYVSEEEYEWLLSRSINKSNLIRTLIQEYIKKHK
ncbi:MAG: hypothetical protein QW478_04975 [Candidatus Micrarchaeaceae archaeon]